jgi:chromosome segregation ATPase
MQMKNTRGVQQEEVWAAADALLAVGQRPTIERVRQRLGRGSPNTVSPMLETWFAGLGKRLGMVGSVVEEGAMPATVIQAMVKIWDAALLAARKEAAAVLALDQEAIANDHALLSDRESKLAQQEQAFIQQQEMMDRLLQVERERTESAEDSLAVTKEQLQLQDYRASELRTTLAATQEQLQTARNHLDELGRRHLEERGKWEERTAGNERRLLGEIDRERQVAKQALVTVEETSALIQTTRSGLEARIETLTQRLQATQIELGTARQALASTELRCTELAGLLQDQRTTNGVMLENLNQTLKTMTSKRIPTKRKTVAAGGQK